ncbi:hypothetical protein GCM10022262_12700 [Georgenia daeguensis]|uniref:Uncharacterized protein n=1 Tax=Georgenia daeguensis TaxID=908355 RepID=A0ABP8ESF2_9MICO
MFSSVKIRSATVASEALAVGTSPNETVMATTAASSTVTSRRPAGRAGEAVGAGVSAGADMALFPPVDATAGRYLNRAWRGRALTV